MVTQGGVDGGTKVADGNSNGNGRRTVYAVES